MKIKKCDICKKTIKDGGEVTVYLTDERFTVFELCAKCGQPIVKFLKSKKLISGKKKK